MRQERTELQKKLIRYGGCFAIGIALVFLLLSLNHYWSLPLGPERMKVLCDAFTLPGMLLCLIAALIFVLNAGAFNGLFYGLRTAKEILLPFLPHEYIKYRDYIEKRKAKRVSGYGFILHVGLVLLAVAIVLIIRFNALYPNA